jgi:hypothetical protein
MRVQWSDLTTEARSTVNVLLRRCTRAENLASISSMGMTHADLSLLTQKVLEGRMVGWFEGVDGDAFAQLINA